MLKHNHKKHLATTKCLNHIECPRKLHPLKAEFGSLEWDMSKSSATLTKFNNIALIISIPQTLQSISRSFTQLLKQGYPTNTSSYSLSIEMTRCHKITLQHAFFVFAYFIWSQVLPVALFMLAHLVRFGFSVRCQVSVKFQYLVKFLSLYWTTGSQTIHPPIEGMLPLLVSNPNPFRTVSKVTRLQVYVTTPGLILSLLHL